MIKIVSMWKRNPDRSADECEQHYREVHTELAKKALANVPGFRRYVQNRICSQANYHFNDAHKPEQVEPEFDRFVELYFDDRESLEKAMSTPEMQACFDDHPNFMHVRTSKNLVIYDVIEEIPLER